MRLGNEILVPKGKRAFSIDLSEGKFATLVSTENYDQRILTEDQPCSLKPGRSSYARCGMLVHFTAPTIHAGYKGTITLEIANLGPAKIALTPGVPIRQLIIEEVRGEPFRNESQFHGQTTLGGK